MLGTTSHDLPLPMPWRRCANTIGDKWVFASPIAKSRDKNYPASCANASPMHSAGRLDGQSRVKREFEKGGFYPSRLNPSRTAYDTDLTDAKWKQLEPLVPPAKAGGRP